MNGAQPRRTSTPAVAGLDGYYDEARDRAGAVRQHWRELLGALDSFGPEETERRWQQGRNLIRENGVTYNVYGDPRGMDRPWELDPIPLVVPAAEWQALETAIIQRATLLDRLLADVYGPQHLLRDGLLPPELVFAHPGFLRPCHGVAGPGGHFLHVYAADLARSPDGRWWVLADRTQAPAGAGYAMENRHVLRRTLPDLFHAHNVRRHPPFFAALRDMLIGLSPRSDQPRVVVLTSGPYNETYFEHAYLARHLGFALVEGGDLTVREQRVFLKTLTGLRQVDVILRRQDDAFCDPLELYQNSTLGVPGLLQAVRAGNVAVANSLGSGVAESAALLAFLEGLCPQILGESLRLPSIATWWCGQESARKYVAQHLESLVFKPAFPSANEPIFGCRLTAAERAELEARLARTPHALVAQEQVSPSTAPVWDGAALAPRHVTLRVYAVAGAAGYTVLPGGLTRVSSREDALVVTMQSGGGSKDTWVLADEPIVDVPLRRSDGGRLEISRGEALLSSRTADNLYWLGRYLERVDFQARLARSVCVAIADAPGPWTDGPPAAVYALPALGMAPLDARLGERAIEREFVQALFQVDRPGNLRATAMELHRVAWLTRQRISLDAWRTLSRIQPELGEVDPRVRLRLPAVIGRLDRAILAISAFAGLVKESMTRGHGWYFLETGRRLERGVDMVELLRATLLVGRSDETRSFEALLDIADSSMTYRSRYQTAVEPRLVLDLLLLDETNPRSIAFQVQRVGEYVAHMPPPASGSHESLFKTSARPLARLQLAEIEELAAMDGRGRRTALAELLNCLTGDLRMIGDAMTRKYLTHAVPMVKI